MAVIRSPFSRGVVPPSRNDGGLGDSLLDEIRRAANEPVVPSPTPSVSVAPTAGAVPRLTVSAPSTSFVSRDDQRQLTAREIERIARGEIAGLRGEVPSDVASRAAQQIGEVTAGGPKPSSGLGKFFGTLGGYALRAAQLPLYPQRAVQAGIGVIGEGLKVVGEPIAREIQSAAAGAGARVPVSVSTTGRPSVESELERILRPATGGDRSLVLEFGTGRKPSARSYRELLNDPSYFLTIPNIRDNIKIPKTGIGLIDNYAKAGLYALDASIELAFQAATDPLSYVTFGANQFAGQGGRAALASRLLQKDAIDVAPTLLNNPERLYRLGEWGLTRGERSALAAADILQPAGLSWNFGERATIGAGSRLGGAISGGLARGVGAPIARVRATVGDIPVMSRIAELTTPQSRRQLTGVARGRVAGGDARRAIVNYSAQQNAKGVYGRISQTLASRYAPLIKEVSESPFRNDVGRIIETQVTTGQLPTGGVVDPVALDLAQRVSAAFADMRQVYNDEIVDFMRRYDLDPQYATQIADIENYFYHTLTPEAQRWVASEGRGMSPDLVPQVTQTLNIGPNEMKVGGGPIRGRKLKAEEEWLGKKLETGSIEEINQRWREVMAPSLGRNQQPFDWFETDAASVLTSYIDSIANQAKRIAYANKLFDYGDEFILPLMSKIVPDENLVAAANAAVNELKKERAAIVRRLTGKAYTGGTPREGARVLSGVRALAQRIVDNGVASVDTAEEAMLKALTRLREQERKLDEAVVDARQQGANIASSYEALIAPIRARVRSLESAIERGQGARELARQELLDEHARLFPRRSKRPQDAETLANEILGLKNKRFEQRVKALETRGGRAGRAAAKAEAGAAKARGVLEETTAAVGGVKQRVDRIRAIEDVAVDADPEFFPDGLIYTTVNHLDGNAETNSASYWFGTTDLDVPEGEILVAAPAPSRAATFDLGSELDDVQEIVGLLPVSFPLQIGEDVFGPVAADWPEWFSSEVGRLVSAPRGTEIDSRVPDELKPLIAAVVGWGWQPDVSPEMYRLYASEIVDALNGMQAVAGMDVDPALSEELFHSALALAANSSERGQGSPLTALIVPSLEWEDDYSIIVNARSAKIVTDREPFVGIVQGSQVWDDVVPAAGALPSGPLTVPASWAGPEPSAAPAVARTKPAVAPPNYQQVRETFGKLGDRIGPTLGEGRQSQLDDLLAEGRKIRKRVRDGDIDSAQADDLYYALISKLDDVTDVAEKAYLLKSAYTNAGAANQFIEAVADRFEMEVEFAIGVAASGADNSLSAAVRAADLSQEQLDSYVASAADTLTLQKVPDYAQIGGVERAAVLDAAGISVSPAGPVVEPSGLTGPSGFGARPERAAELEAEGERVAAGLPALRERVSRAETTVAGKQAEQQAVERSLRATRGAQTRSSRVIGERVARAQDDTVRVGREKLTEKQAGGRLRAERRALEAKEKELNRALSSDPVLKQVPKEQRTVDKLATVFDSAQAAVADKTEWVNNVAPLYTQDIVRISELIDQASGEFPDVQTAMAWARNVRDVVYQLNDPSVFDNNLKLRDTWERVMMSMFAQETQLAELESKIVISEGIANRLANAQIGARMSKDILDGWVELERLGVQIPRELRDEMFAGVKRLQSPREWGRFMRYYYSYQRFFKSYAISTPGFIVRNSMTAAFNNMVAGVRANDQRAAIKFAAVYYRDGLEAALNSVPASQRARFEQAFEAVSRTGGGQSIDELMPLVKGKGSRLYNNWYTRGFQRANEAAEIAARMGMALDGTTRGWSVEENAARIARYHFDYSDISQLDAVAKTFIPFWTFASRNVQLQYVNRLARPALYNRWEDVQKLGPEVDDENWPIYLRERGAIPLSATQYLAPDLPQIDMVQQARRLADPVLLASQANPLIRAGIETISQRSTAFDYPYSQAQQPLGVTDWPSAVLGEALDLFTFGRSNVSRPLSGTATAFVRDLGPSLIPPLQQFQRYAQAGASAAGVSPETQQMIGGRPTYAQRDPVAALAGYLGVPYGTVTPQQFQNELLRQQYAIRDIGRAARGG